MTSIKSSEQQGRSMVLTQIFIPLKHCITGGIPRRGSKLTQIMHICDPADTSWQALRPRDMDLYRYFGDGFSCYFTCSVRLFCRNWCRSILQRDESGDIVGECAVILHILVYEGGDGFSGHAVRW